MGESSTLPPDVSSIGTAVAEIDSLVHDFLEGLHKRLDDLLGAADDRSFGEVAAAVERTVRSVESAAVKIVGDVDRRMLFLTDGHRSVKGWTAANLRVPDSEVAKRVQLAHLIRHAPVVGELLSEGLLGVAQAREIARLLHNPRLDDEVVVASVDEFLDWALHDDHRTFVARTRDWEQAMDADGAYRDSEAAHNGRDVKLSDVGDTTYLDGRFGTLQGDVLRQIHQAFIEAEFRADCEQARRNPDDTSADTVLSRTAAQRRADALFNIFVSAANAPLGGKPIEVVVNLVCDQQTFEEQLADMVDPVHRHDRRRGRTADAARQPAGVASVGPGRFCRTLSGAPVAPAAAVAAALTGHVRRVVVGADSVVIDLGRKARCFTGSARDAAFLQAAVDRVSRCIWPGCRLPFCQVDHAVPWADDGHTTVDNSTLLCRHHNVLKTLGYTTRRDSSGRWHLYRPDGTEIAPT